MISDSGPNDSIGMATNHNYHHGAQQHGYGYTSKYSGGGGSNTNSPSSNNSSNNNNNNNSSFSTFLLPTQHVNRHIKNNSVDVRFTDDGGGFENVASVGGVGSGGGGGGGGVGGVGVGAASPILGGSTTSSASSSSSSNNHNSVLNKVFPPLATQTNASSTVSLEYARF